MNTSNDEATIAKLERLRQQLASEASKIRRGSLLTLLLGLVCVAALSFYFYYGYSQFSEVLEHERVADAVATIVEEHLPSVRKALEEEARKSAPAWAEGLSKQLRESLPMGRKKLEEYVIDQTKSTLDKGTVLTQEQFAKFIQTNNVILRKDIEDLSKKPELAESAVAELEKSLANQLDTDLKANATDLVYILTAFNEKLDKLSKNQNLDQTESIERRLAMIVRRVQSEKVASADLVPKTNAPTQPVVAPSTPSGREPGDVESIKIKTDAKPEAPKEAPKSS